MCSFCPTEILYPLKTVHSPLPQPRASTIALSIELFQVFHIRGITQFLSFCDWLILRSMMSSGFLYVVIYMAGFPFILRLNDVHYVFRIFFSAIHLLIGQVASLHFIMLILQHEASMKEIRLFLAWMTKKKVDISPILTTILLCLLNLCHKVLFLRSPGTLALCNYMSIYFTWYHSIYFSPLSTVTFFVSPFTIHVKGSGSGLKATSWQVWIGPSHQQLRSESRSQISLVHFLVPLSKKSQAFPVHCGFGKGILNPSIYCLLLRFRRSLIIIGSNTFYIKI